VSIKFLILRRIERDINVHKSSCEVPRYPCQIVIKIEFSRQISKNAKTLNFTKIHSVGASLCPSAWTDGRTEKRVDFRNFATHA